MVLAIVMALSVFSGISFSAFAAEVKSIELKLTKPITVLENSNGYWNDEDDSDSFYKYFYSFSDGDEVVITMNNNSVNTYTFDEYKYDFIDENGNFLEDWYTEDNQYDEHWFIGKHTVTFWAYDVSTEFSVEVISSPVESVKTSFTVKEITENTCGYWNVDEDDNYYFNYDFYYLFDDGDTITLNMKDGTSVVYTMKEMYFEDEGWSYNAFVNDDDEELSIINYLDNQYEEHLGLGIHKLHFLLTDYGIDFAISVKIVEGFEDTCWHSTDWKFVNGIYQSECLGCGKITKIPFTDLKGFENYVDFIAYTSVYNDYIRGINPPENTIFSPKTSINRAMLITILYRMAGEPYSDGSNPYSSTPFTDIVNENAYYYDAACWALKNGITTETTFKPFDNVTREQTVTLLFRYAQNNDMLGNDNYKLVDLKSEYLDASLIHPWAAEAMQWANYNNMITGTLQGFANPNGATLRIHATKILCGFGNLCNIGNYE